jgi:hypothetical protein
VLVPRIPRDLGIDGILQREGKHVSERRKRSKRSAAGGDLGDIRLGDELRWSIDGDVGRKSLSGKAVQGGEINLRLTLLQMSDDPSLYSYVHVGIVDQDFVCVQQTCHRIVLFDGMGMRRAKSRDCKRLGYLPSWPNLSAAE